MLLPLIVTRNTIPAGLTILSNGRFLKPAGQAFPVDRWPHGLAMSRDGELLFVASAGSGRIFRNWRAAEPTSQEIKPPPRGPKKNRFNTGGADFSPDGRWLYWSGGEDGKVYLFDTAQGQLVAEIPLNTAVAGREYEDSYVVDVKVSEDGTVSVLRRCDQLPRRGDRHGAAESGRLGAGGTLSLRPGGGGGPGLRGQHRLVRIQPRAAA